MGIPYDPTVPATGTRPSSTYTTIQTNFNSIKTLVDVDHVDFASSSYGEHKQVNFNAPQAAPGTTGTKGVLYTKTVSAITQLFFQNASTDTQITGLASSIASPGYITLPGGLIVQWGTVTSATNGQAVVYPIAFPTAAFLVVATIRSNAVNRFIATFNTTGASQFNVALSTTSDIQWIALGN